MENGEVDILEILVNHNDEIDTEFFIDNISYFGDVANKFVEIFDGYEYEEGFDEYFTSSELFELARDYLNTINPRYADIFNKSLINGTINFFDAKNMENYDLYDDYAYFDYIEEGDNVHQDINIPSDYNIDALFALIHEFIHSVSLKKGRNFYDCLCGETAPIMHEFLLFEFLKEKGIALSDSIKVINNRFANTRELADCISKYCESYNEFYNDDDYNLKKIATDENSYFDTGSYIDSFYKMVKYLMATLVGMNVYDYLIDGIDALEVINFCCDKISNENFDVISIFKDIPNDEDLEIIAPKIIEHINNNSRQLKISIIR